MQAGIRLSAALLLLGWLVDLGYRAATLSHAFGSGRGGIDYPLWVLAATAILVVAHAATDWPDREATAQWTLPRPVGRVHLLRYGAFLGLWVAYVLLLPRIGFLVATVAAVAGSILVLERVRVWVALLIAAIFGTGLKVLFVTVFYISLPQGPLDRALSELLYALMSGELSMDGILLALQPLSLAAGLLGLVFGMIFGAIPGLSATLAVALLLPVTFFMPPDQGLIMLGGVYAGGVYAGAISAILLNVPGTVASVVTAMEGHQLARQGRRASIALGLSAVCSGIGGVFSALALLSMAPALADFALRFGPAEYVGVIGFSLVVVTMMLPTPLLGNAAGCLFGLALGTIGLDPLTGTSRFTYGMYELASGPPLVPMLIGFFAMPQVLVLAWGALTRHSERQAMVPMGSLANDYRLLCLEVVRHWATIVRATLVGIGMGILPAIGPAATPVTMHALERRFARDPERYGKGSITGLIAAETSNNANVGGSLIPLLALGIPGSGAAALFLGALTVHGLQPGPMMFRNSGQVLTAFFTGFIIVNLALIVIGLLFSRYFTIVLRIPEGILATLIAALSIFGAYASGNSMYYVWALLAGTVLALILNAIRIPLLAVLMGFILGPLLEEQLVMMATSFRSAGDLLGRPIALGFGALTLAVAALLARQRLATIRELGRTEILDRET